MSIENVTAVASGGKFCDCGGLMVADGGLLMSDPPKQEVRCPFCGNKEIVSAPYVVNIEFKKAP